MEEFGAMLAACISDSDVGLVGLVDFGEFTAPRYHNYAWRTISRLRRGDDVKDWEAAFVLFGITKCVAKNYADNDRDTEGSVWGAIATEIENVRPKKDQRHPRRLTVVEQSQLGKVYRHSLYRFRFPHPDDFELEGPANIGPMLFHAGFAGATIKPVVRLIRRAHGSLKGFDNTADSDVRRQWVSTTQSKAVVDLHSWPKKMLASFVPAVDDLWQTLVAIVRLHDEDKHEWTMEDLRDFGIPGVQSKHLLEVLTEARVTQTANQAARSGVQARLYFGSTDEAPCPRLFIGNDVRAPQIQQLVGDQWQICDASHTKTRFGDFADLDTPIAGSKVRLLDGDREVRTWNLHSSIFPGVVFSRVGGTLVDAKTIDGAGIFSGERLVLFDGTPEFQNWPVERAEQIDLLWRYHDLQTPWTAWRLQIASDEHELRFSLNGESHCVPICRDRHSPICFRGEPCKSVSAVSQDGQTMPLYSDHPVVEQDGARPITVVCDIEGSQFSLHRKNYRRRLRVEGGQPLTGGAGVFQIRRLQFPQVEVARYAVIPTFQIRLLRDDVREDARFEIIDDESGVFHSDSDGCQLAHESDDNRWVFTTPRDQPFQEIEWRPRFDSDDESSQPGQPVRLRIAIPGVRWRLVSRADGQREPVSIWTNKRLPVRQHVANRQAMELDVSVPIGCKLIVQDQTMQVRPRQTASGDIYRLRLSGQERPKFVTEDGTIYEPAILSTHPLISGIRVEQIGNSSYVQIVGAGHFLNDVTVWAWPTHDLEKPAKELHVISDDEGFMLQWPSNEEVQIPVDQQASSFSFVLGRRDSDGLFGDTIDYAKEDLDEMRLHSGWVLKRRTSDDLSSCSYELDALDDPLTNSFHHHRVLGMFSGQTSSAELSNEILQVLCASSGELRCSQFSSLDAPNSPIPWQYLANLVALRDELTPELDSDGRNETRKGMMYAANCIFDFHEQENISLPHKVMPLFFARSLGQVSSEFVQILGWGGQRAFKIAPSDDPYYNWLQAIGLISIRFRRELVGVEVNQQEVTWDMKVGKLMFQDNRHQQIELPGRLEFTPLKDGAVGRIAATLAIASCLHSRIDRANLYDSRSSEGDPIPDDLRQELQIDYPSIHERVRKTDFAGEDVQDPDGHIAFTLQCVWTLSWAIAQALTGNWRYQALLHRSDTSRVMRNIRQQPAAFRVGIALAALTQAVVNDGGLGCAARFQTERLTARPR